MGAAWALWVFHRFPPKTLYAFGQGGFSRRLRACLRPSRGAPAPRPSPTCVAAAHLPALPGLAGADSVLT